MTTTRTHAAPWTLASYLADLFSRPKPARPREPDLLTGREATARHLFGEACQWSRLDMAEYDNSPLLRGGWLAEADRRIAHAASPDRHVTAHHRISPSEWDAMPALVKKDLREDFYAAKWGRS